MKTIFQPLRGISLVGKIHAGRSFVDPINDPKRRNVAHAGIIGMWRLRFTTFHNLYTSSVNFLQLLGGTVAVAEGDWYSYIMIRMRQVEGGGTSKKNMKTS